MAEPEGMDMGEYRVTNISTYKSQICFMEKFSPHDSPWIVENPLIRYFPKLAMQLGISLFLMRILIVILKPLRQPRFVAEITASILLGPTVFDMFDVWKIKFIDSMKIYPVENMLVLETFANLGLTYYMFLLGLEMDLSTVRNLGKKSWSIAIAGIFIPFIVGTSLYFVPLVNVKYRVQDPVGSVFWAITLTITSFPDLVRVLSDVKLLHTELGRIALSSTLVNDISTWAFLVFAIAMVDDHSYKMVLTTLPIIAFVVICWFVLRPGIAWLINRTKKEGGGFSDMHIYFILIGVAAFGFITDACGSHSLIGGYIFGLIIPRGELSIKILERTEEFVNGVMLPSFLVVSGLRTNFVDIAIKTKFKFWMMITVCATAAKIASTFLVSLCFGMSLRDSLTLGALMNTKGILALIVINEARSVKALDNISMGVMVLTILFMTSLVEPIVLLLNGTKKRSRKYKQRTIQGSKQDAQLRILTCVHAVRNISGIINILEVSNATRKSPISVFVVHLVQLNRRASAMLIVHDTVKTGIENSPSREKAESDQIISAFENCKSRNEAVSVYPLTAVSPYTTMHEDICNLAEDKIVNIILVPFHKQPTADGGFQGENRTMREVNQNLLAKAPCSVGILVDRGLRSSVRSDSFSGKLELRFAMFFIGGPDDHEALSYAWRMSGTQCVALTVVRFRMGKDVEVDTSQGDKKNEDGSAPVITERDIKKEIDDEFINEFRFKTMCDESITYYEKLVNNCNELVEAIRTVYNSFDLYIVGRGRGEKSPLTKELTGWGDSPELGPIGETLVSSHFTAHASVLVVQQSSCGGFATRLQHHKRKFVRKELGFTDFRS